MATSQIWFNGYLIILELLFTNSSPYIYLDIYSIVLKEVNWNNVCVCVCYYTRIVVRLNSSYISEVVTTWAAALAGRHVTPVWKWQFISLAT